MKGIILAGGSGTRLHPLTRVTSKQLLPVYDKPLIFYPIATLMLAGIKEFLIITTPKDSQTFNHLLGNGNQWGISIQYEVQEEPKGLAQGLIIGENFLDGDSCAFILGDNIFYGQGLGRMLSKHLNVSGAHIFAYKVVDPERYGVATISKDGKVEKIIEKPKSPDSDLAVTGLYFYDGSAVQRAKLLKPSQRGELEITDLNNSYLASGDLSATILPPGTAWFDTGTFSALHDASTYIRIIEERQGIRIADLDSIYEQNLTE
jgi:glucose-1-phosphate thymidylyltransferase